MWCKAPFAYCEYTVWMELEMGDMVNDMGGMGCMNGEFWIYGWSGRYGFGLNVLYYLLVDTRRLIR